MCSWLPSLYVYYLLVILHCLLFTFHQSASPEKNTSSSTTPIHAVVFIFRSNPVTHELELLLENKVTTKFNVPNGPLNQPGDVSIRSQFYSRLDLWKLCSGSDRPFLWVYLLGWFWSHARCGKSPEWGDQQWRSCGIYLALPNWFAVSKIYTGLRSICATFTCIIICLFHCW